MITRKSIKLFAVGNIAVLLAASFVILQSPSKYPESVLLRGDFPAFFAAGKLSLTAPAELYNPESQAAIQRLYWPSYGDQFHYFTYPPQMALVFGLLSNFSPRVAQNTWVILQVMCLALSCYFISLYMWGGRGWFWFFLISFSFFPLFIGVVSGQNTALTILLLLFAIITASRENKLPNTLSGVVVGLLLFKPHYAALAFLILFLVRGRYIFCGFLLSAAFQLLIISLFLQNEWFGDWLRGISFFNKFEGGANADGIVSLWHILTAVFSSFSATDKSFSLALNLGFSVFGGVIVGLLIRRRCRIEKTPLLNELLFYIPFAIVFFSPHTMYYDTGILLLSVSALIANLSDDKKVLVPFCLSLIVANLLTAYRPILFGSYLASMLILLLLLVKVNAEVLREPK